MTQVLSVVERKAYKVKLKVTKILQKTEEKVEMNKQTLNTKKRINLFLAQ